MGKVKIAIETIFSNEINLASARYGAREVTTSRLAPVVKLEMFDSFDWVVSLNERKKQLDPRGFGEMGRMAIFQGAGELW